MINVYETLLMEVNNNRVASDYELNVLKGIEKNSMLLKKRLSKKERKLL